jgi:hypothetical protein
MCRWSGCYVDFDIDKMSFDAIKKHSSFESMRFHGGGTAKGRLSGRPRPLQAMIERFEGISRLRATSVAARRQGLLWGMGPLRLSDGRRLRESPIATG